MQLASVGIGSEACFGVVEGDRFKDLSGPLRGRCADLRELLGRVAPEEVRALAAGAPSCALSQVRFAPPIPNPDARIFAVGWSYGDHQLETGKPPPERPFFFLKSPWAVVGHDAPIERPAVSEKFDFEGEIAIVVGRGGRHIAPADARAHIAGFALFMDGSVRDWQQHSVTAGKNFDRSSSFGPTIVTADEIPDPGAIQLRTRLNGTQMQAAAFSEMVWDIGELIAYLSTVTALRPGDVISTGTPAGVGHKRKPPVFMRPGDVLEVEATGLGVLRNTVVQE